MSLIPSLLALLALLAFGFMALLGVAVFVTHLVETRPVRFLIPAPADDPDRAKLLPCEVAGKTRGSVEQNPYASPSRPDYATEQNRAAAALGFTSQDLFVHAKGGHYKVHTVLWVSPERRVLAVIGWGTVVRLNASKSMLYSRLADGRHLMTCDRPPGSDVPGLDELLIVLDAPLDLLVRRHTERLAGLGVPVLPFDDAEALAGYEAILERRARFSVEHGNARYTDAGHTAIKSTLKGAAKGMLRSWRPPTNIEKVATGTGPATARPFRPKYPAPLVWADRVVTVLVVASAVMIFRFQSPTPAQSLFRLGLFGFTMLGIVGVWLVKLVIRQRSA